LLLVLLLLCWLWGGGQYFKDPRHEANVSNPQRVGNIWAKIHSHGGSCSNGNGFFTATTDINGRSSVRYHDMMNKFSVGLDKTGTVVASHGDANVHGLQSPIGSDDIPKVLSFMETAVGTLCLNTPTPNPSPDNDTSPAHSSGSVALGFFRPQGNTNG
jgi:hypothetical protein